MRKRCWSWFAMSVLLGLAALVSLGGCKKETGAMSAEDVSRFQNPPKEMPPEAAQLMQQQGAGGKPQQADGAAERSETN